MSRILDIYLHDIFTGHLSRNESGSLSFTYDADYLARWRPALSLSLPLGEKPHEGTAVHAFFSGLLPDDVLRHRLAQLLGLSEKNPFSLLEVVGGECAGAVALYPSGTPPLPSGSGEVEILDDRTFGEILETLRRRPLLAGEDGLRLSLAGAQDKLAVGMVEERIALLRGQYPTTHIIKPLIERVTDSVHNEFFCMCLAREMDITTPAVKIGYLGETPYFLVERYDRIISRDGSVLRLHQEDVCQALGIVPELRYEREGGPGIAQCLDVLHRHSSRPAADQIAFIRRVIFNFLIGNADAHGKNVSLLYRGIKPELAPAYDLMSTAVYPDLSANMAMKIGGQYRPEQVMLRHWLRLVPDTATARRSLKEQLAHMARICPVKAQALCASLEDKGIRSGIFAQICTVIETRAEHLAFILDS